MEMLTRFVVMCAWEASDGFAPACGFGVGTFHPVLTPFAAVAQTQAPATPAAARPVTNCSNPKSSTL